MQMEPEQPPLLVTQSESSAVTWPKASQHPLVSGMGCRGQASAGRAEAASLGNSLHLPFSAKFEFTGSTFKNEADFIC